MSSPESGHHLVDFGDGNYAVIGYDTEMSTEVVPVIVRTPDQKVVPLGTAFAIANLHRGFVLYATARHVVTAPVGVRRWDNDLARAPDGTEPFILTPRSLDDSNVMGVPITGIF